MITDDPALLRVLAEACRRLARMFEEPERKALWIERGGSLGPTRDRGRKADITRNVRPPQFGSRL